MQVRICKILELLLSADFKFLLSIETDMLGMRYEEALNSGTITPGYEQTASVLLTKSSYAVYKCLMSLRRNFLATLWNTGSPVCARELLELKDMILSTNGVSEHSVTETRDALSLVVPYVDMNLLSVQIVEAKRVYANNEVIFSLLTSERWHTLSLEADPISAKLKQASAMCMLVYCELSLKVLQDLQDRLEQQISVCGCYGSENHNQAYFEKTPSLNSECSYKESLRRHFMPCVVYLPAERDLNPPALCYEMDRSTGSPTEDREHCYDWAVVDGKVLFYFLIYLNHHHLGMEEHAQADIRNIQRLFMTVGPLRHPETLLNILAWIFKERGHAAIARVFCLMPLIYKPTHNATSLHLQDINSAL